VATAEIRKAAVVLMSLPQEQAAGLLSKLPPRQVEAVAIEIARSRSVTSEEQQSVIREFAHADPQSLVAGRGGFDIAKTLVERALGKGSRTLDHVRQAIEAPHFGFLRRVEPQDLLAFLVDEHPQTIALILSHLPASYAAAIVPALSDERQSAVIRRIAAMGETHSEMVREVARALERRMSHVICQPFEHSGGVAAVADILHGADRATERSVLENLAHEDPELAIEIRRSLFAFEDIDKFSHRDIQTISKNVDSWQWATALQGAGDELKHNVLAKLSPRARALLEKEMERLGAVHPATIEQVQRQIVDMVRRLHDAGKINAPSVDKAEAFIR
jgi:flagellar motor switch protein FliG